MVEQNQSPLCLVAAVLVTCQKSTNILFEKSPMARTRENYSHLVLSKRWMLQHSACHHSLYEACWLIQTCHDSRLERCAAR